MSVGMETFQGLIRSPGSEYVLTGKRYQTALRNTTTFPAQVLYGNPVMHLPDDIAKAV